MEGKPVLNSKTIGVNIVAAIAILLQHKYGYVMDAELQGLILVFINLLLRFVTKKAIAFKKKELQVLSVLFVLVMFAGCGTTSMLCSVPEADGSVICELSKKINTTPEAISQSLKIANAGAMELDVYDAYEAEKFVDKIISEIQEVQKMGKEVSYREAIEYIRGIYSKLPERVQLIFEIASPDMLSQNLIEIPLTDYDFKLLLDHLNNQKNIINMYKTRAAAYEFMKWV